MQAPVILFPPTHLHLIEYSVVNSTAHMTAAWAPPLINLELFNYYLLTVTDGPIASTSSAPVFESVLVSYFFILVKSVYLEIILFFLYSHCIILLLMLSFHSEVMAKHFLFRYIVCDH